MEEEMMDVQQVARYLGLAEETIEGFVHTNQIPFIQTADGLRFEKGVIDIWVQYLDHDSMTI
jgi:excisionase family DNA binding protein